MNECPHAEGIARYRNYDCSITGADCCMEVPVAKDCPILDEIKPTCANCKYSCEQHDLYFKCTDGNSFNNILPIDRLNKSSWDCMLYEPK